MPRFSANLGFLWVELPLLERIEKAAQAGFTAVELHFPYDTPPEAARAKCAELDVTLLGINTNVSETHKGLAAVPGQEDAFKTLANQAMDWAHAAGGTSVHVMAGFVPADQHEAGRRTIVANLKWAATRAGELGLTLLLEPLNTRDMPGYFYSRAHQAAEIITEVGAPNLKLMFDAYHVGIEGDDVIATLKQYWDITGHIQIASFPSRSEPGSDPYDFRPFFAAVDELGYASWIGCEYKPRTTVEEGLGWTSALGVTL